jgi:Flp pilus assembly protein TadG
MRRRAHQRGSTLVETALVTLAFLTTVFGLMSVSYLIFTYNSMAFLAQQGSRWASVRGNNSGQPATSATVQAFVLTQAAGFNTQQLTIQTTWSPDENPGSTVTVAVTYNATPFFGSFLPSTLTFKSTSALPISR